MTIDERKDKLKTLPWQALYDLAVKKEVDETEINGKDKETIINRLLSTDLVSDGEIETLVNDYIYGNRVTFTLWSFRNPLTETDYAALADFSGYQEPVLSNASFRNLQVISVVSKNDRVEILYVYSKEYIYTDEDGHSAAVWEQHRGCLWIGKNMPYLAVISKHDRMTGCIIHVISEFLKNSLTQMNPPKSAIERCINYTARSRIVLQGADGEKTIISRSGGLTEDQETEISRIREQRIDTSGSYIADITEGTSASVKYNIKKGSIGILKCLPAPVLFDWSQNAINVIFEEVEKMKGRPAEENFNELGLEPKWPGLTNDEKKGMNDFLTCTIAALDQNEDEYSLQLGDTMVPLLANHSLFLRIPRTYCNICESYEVPICGTCKKELKHDKYGWLSCDCGAPFSVVCPEDHPCNIVYWYVPTKKFRSMIDQNIHSIYKSMDTEYFMCITEQQLHIVKADNNSDGTEILFDNISCFNACPSSIEEVTKGFAVHLNEKCDGTCSKAKVSQCLSNPTMLCLPKIFYPILPGFHPQPHKGSEYGDVSGEVLVGSTCYEMKGILKKNTKNTRTEHSDDELINEYLLSTSKEGGEIIRQFVEQGLADNRCQLIAVAAPQYFDSGLKGTLRYLARIGGKHIVFIGLDEICRIIEANDSIIVPN